jgi:hypothetical protein
MPLAPDGGANAPPEFSGERAARLVERRQTATVDRLAKVAADEQRVLQLQPKPGKTSAWSRTHSRGGRRRSEGNGRTLPARQRAILVEQTDVLHADCRKRLDGGCQLRGGLLPGLQYALLLAADASVKMLVKTRIFNVGICP